MGHKAATSRRSGHVDNENAIQCAASELAGERKIQRPLHLSAQLLGLLRYPPASVSLSMPGFLQGSFKFRIDQFGRNVSPANAFRHGNSLPRTHAVRRAPVRQSCVRNARTVSSIAVKAVGARSDGPEELPAGGQARLQREGNCKHNALLGGRVKVR